MENKEKLLADRDCCYYCRKTPPSSTPVKNPYTQIAHPTCEVCAYYFKLVDNDLRLYKVVRTLFWVALLLFVIYFWGSYGWLVLPMGFGLMLVARYIYQISIERVLLKKRRVAFEGYKIKNDLS